MDRKRSFCCWTMSIWLSTQTVLKKKKNECGNPEILSIQTNERVFHTNVANRGSLMDGRDFAYECQIYNATCQCSDTLINKLVMSFALRHWLTGSLQIIPKITLTKSITSLKGTAVRTLGSDSMWLWLVTVAEGFPDLHGGKTISLGFWSEVLTFKSVTSMAGSS